MSKFRLCAGAFVALTGISALLWGQAVNGSLVGTVTDSSGGVVPNAKITILEVNTGATRNSNTNDSGNYSFTDLPPGTYRVDVEATGFKHEVRSGIDVLVNQTPRVDMQIQPGAVSETIEVSGEPPALQTDRADTS